MLTYMSVFTALALCSAAYCQTGQPLVHNGDGSVRPRHRVSAQEMTNGRIRLMLDSTGTALAAADIPLLRRMGDGAASEVLALTKDRGPLTAVQQANAVAIVRKAFEKPSVITKESNRTPTSSLALLDQIASSSTDFALKLKVADTRQLILAAAAK